MNILVACEESQVVCKEFRKLGHIAYSCDIIECSGSHPEWHIQQDVLEILNPGIQLDGLYYGIKPFYTQDGTLHFLHGKWDMIIAHPPCTYLTVAANKLYSIEKYGEKAVKRLEDREKAIEFFMAFVNADCERKAIENPIGVMSTRYRKPDQIIQPSKGKSGGYSGASWCVRDEKGKILSYKDPRVAKARSKTYQGIGQAIAEQWGGV